MRRRAAIYVKGTKEVGADGAGPERQLEESEEYCGMMGLEVAARYCDLVGSREGFGEMMAAAGGGGFEWVVVWKLRYFAWRLEESVEAQGELGRSGVGVLSVKERTPGERGAGAVG